MFNQLTPAEVVTAIGATVRSTARSEGETSAFERGQLMSAYSATRHLAVELASFEAELHRFTQDIAREVRSAEAPAIGDELTRLADRLDVASDARTVGAAICELFEILCRDGSPPAQTLRREVHARLRSLADTEVNLLADALG